MEQEEQETILREFREFSVDAAKLLKKREVLWNMLDTFQQELIEDGLVDISFPVSEITAKISDMTGSKRE